MNKYNGMFFEAEGNPGQPPAAEPPKPESDHMIPKSRFDEVNNKNKELQAKMDRLEKEQQEALEKRLAEQSQWEELAKQRGIQLEEKEQKAKKAEELEKALNEVYETQVKEIPEDRKKLIPEKLPVQDRLNFINANREFLFKPKAPDIGAGERGGAMPDAEASQLSAEEKAVAARFGYSAEEYAKHK